MKTKTLTLLTGSLVLVAFLASAQSETMRITRSVSKDVQKISNKAWLSNESLLTVSSVGYPVWTITKGVQPADRKFTGQRQSGNIISIGYPVWTISKGVHRRTTTPVKKDPGRNPIMKDVIV